MKPLGQLNRFVHLILEDEFTEFAGSAAAQTDDSFFVCGQNILVDPRHVVVTVQEGDRGHADEIAEAGAILSEQSEMKTGIAAAAGFSIAAFARGHVSFIADDWIEAGRSALLIKLDGAVKIAVIRQSQGVHALLFGAGDELRNSAGAIEQAVMTVTMQMNERPV